MHWIGTGVQTLGITARPSAGRLGGRTDKMIDNRIGEQTELRQFSDLFLNESKAVALL